MIHHLERRSNCLPHVKGSGDNELSSAEKLSIVSILTNELSHMDDSVQPGMYDA